MKTLLLVAAVALAGDAATIERLRADLSEIETRLELFKRMIPAEFDLASERQWIDRLAAKAELSAVVVKVIPGTERVAPLEINRLEIGGRAPYDAVHFFLSMLRTRAPLTGVDSLAFEAAPDDTVRFTARLAYLSMAETEPESVTRPDVVAALRERVARARATEETITDAVGRVQQGRIVDSLAAFTEELEKEPVALTSVRIADGITIDGFLLGTSVGEAVQRGLAKGRLNASRFERSPAGPCQSFSIVARREPSDDLAIAEGGFTQGRNVFDAESVAFCRAERQQPAVQVVAGDVSDAAPFLRLRDFDLADVFFVLNDLLNEDFLIDQDVAGRVDLVIGGKASLDDALRALERTGLSIGPPPLRRVSRGPAGKPQVTGGGEPVSFVFREGDLASVLCLSSQIAGREVVIPAETRGVVRLFATEVPIGVIVAALTPKAAAGGVDACKAPGMPRSRLRRIAMESPPAIADLRVAGIAQVGDGWRAYGYAPGGRLVPVNAGDKFADGSAESVTSTGVVFAADTGGKIERRLVLSP